MKIFKLLVLWSLFLIHCQVVARNVEMRIPAKPDTVVLDMANILGSLGATVVANEINDVKKLHHIPFYLITVDSSYLPHIDTFIQLLCGKWQICGDNDDACLVIMANNAQHDRIIVTGKHLDYVMNDTVCAFIAATDVSDLATVTVTAYPDDIAKGTVRMISEHLSSPSTLLHDPDYEEYKMHYGEVIGPPSTSDKIMVWAIAIGLILFILFLAWGFILKRRYSI